MRNTKKVVSRQLSVVSCKHRLLIAVGKMLAQAIVKHEDEGKTDACR
jgi:hypothetical protein